MSYVREDAPQVRRLQQALQDAGIPVWRDTERLWPGQDWRAEIRKAITNGSIAFLACFSEQSNSRLRSYQNEEILLAIEQMRLRPPGRPWLIPIRFSDTAVPSFDLGPGARTLDDLIHRVDLFGDRWESEIERLTTLLRTILPTPLDATVGAPERLKVPTRLVERPRQERWWHGLDVIAPVPTFPDPTVSDSLILATLEGAVYCLDANFGYARTWEYSIGDPVARASSVQAWPDSGTVALTALLRDGRYQAIVLDPNGPQGARRRTFINGEPYRPMYLSEDRYPLNPIVVGSNLVLQSPYGHILTMPTQRRKSLGRGRKVRVDSVAAGSAMIVHVANRTESWLEWLDPASLDRLAESRRYRSVFGLTTGHVGTAPIAHGSTVLCGFGDRLSCLDRGGTTLWEFPYPSIDALDEGAPLAVYAEGEEVYRTRSEVMIASRLVAMDQCLYFILAEATRHVSYLTKLDIETGRVLWTCRIDGFSQGLNIADVSPTGILLQYDTRLWQVTHDGLVRAELELEMDCTSCSNLVRVSENTYVLLADLGIHTTRLVF